MIRSACLILFLLSISLFSINIGSAEAELEGSRKPLAVSAEVYENLILVRVTVNGAMSPLFLVDSGASECVLNKSLAEALGLSSRQHEASLGSGEFSTSVGFAKGVVLSLPGIELPPQKVAVISLAGIEARIGCKIGGIIGAEIFKRYVVTIDYEANQLLFSEPADSISNAHEDAIPLKLSGNRPFIHVQITTVSGTRAEGEFAVDTGDTSTVTFHTPFVEKHALRTKDQAFVPHFSTGLSGLSKSWRGRIQSLQAGTFVLNQPIANFSEARKGSESDPSYSGIIGGEILRRFRITLDYSRHRMLLEPNVHFNDPYEDDMSGATVVALGPDLRALTVSNLVDNSAAAKAGMKVNDILESVDGQPVTELSLERIKEMFRRDGRTYSLGIRRDGQSISLMMKLQRLI